MRRASIFILCALLGACAGNRLEMRPSSSGFSGGSVLHPLEDGRQHLAAGRNGLAIQRFGEELGRHPRSLDALNGIAIAYAGIGRYDVAGTYFERALQFEPRDARTLNNYGRSLLDQGRLRDARPFLEQALRYAGEGDVPVIAANMLRIRDAAPPSVLAALRRPAHEAAGPKLVRVAANRHRLRTAIRPAVAPASAKHVVDRTIVQLSAVGSHPPAPPVPPAKPRLVGSHGMPVTLAAAPTPELKPVWLRPIRRAQRAESLPAARPAPGPHDDLPSIRSLIGRRVTSTDFDDVLDGIFASPAAGFDPSAIDQGIWT